MAEAADDLSMQSVLPEPRLREEAPNMWGVGFVHPDSDVDGSDEEWAAQDFDPGELLENGVPFPLGDDEPVPEEFEHLFQEDDYQKAMDEAMDDYYNATWDGSDE